MAKTNNIDALHQDVLYPVVRVRTDKSGGSGTVIACLPDPKHPDESHTFVLTNAHVIESAIKTRDDWDSLLKRETKKEFLSPVTVEIFSYVYTSKVNSSDSYKAQIIAYDKHHDIAVLKLDSPKTCNHTARLYPKDQERDIKLFTDVYSVGCSLLHEPFANKGQVTYMDESHENKLYWMSNASIVFGNSGGAIFLADSREFIGIPARVTSLQLGFGVDIMTWMGFFIPVCRVYEFFDEQELQFLYGSSPSDWPHDEPYTYYDAMDRRRDKQASAPPPPPIPSSSPERDGSNRGRNRPQRG